MKTSNVYFGVTSQRFLKALKANVAKYAPEHPILDDVYIGFKKLPGDVPQKDKQVIIQSLYSTDTDNQFIRWQAYGVSVYAKSLSDVERLAATIEGVCSMIGGEEGIRSVEVVVASSETESAFSALSRNQSTLEEWRLATVEVCFTPVQFTSNPIL